MLYNSSNALYNSEPVKSHLISCYNDFVEEKLIRSFLNDQMHMIVSTVGENNKPEAALVGFGLADDLSLIFGTYTTTRKFKNLESNPAVAIVFGNNEKITVQYEGIAAALEGEELAKYKVPYFKKIPSSKKYETNPDQVYLKVTPSWIRYTNYNKDPIEVFEISL